MNVNQMCCEMFKHGRIIFDKQIRLKSFLRKWQKKLKPPEVKDYFQQINLKGGNLKI